MAWTNKLFRRVHSFEIDGATLGIGQNTVSIKPNTEDMQIAYKIWVELSTRKIGLEIDFDHDVIEEIYNSWHEFFGVTRELVKNIPVNKMRKDKSTKELVRLSIAILNDGVRPHLTKWQARFRRWYKAEVEKDKNCDLSPQDCQRNFPRYDELVQDMKQVKSRLIEYRKYMGKLALE